MSSELWRKNNLANLNPARIPPQTPPAGGKSVEAGRIQNPRQIVSPCRVRIISFNHLDFARNTFELCPEHTAYVKTLEFISRVFTYTRSVQVFRQVYTPFIKLRSKSDYSFKSRVNPLLSALTTC